jgi:hypothetical protein
MGKSWRASYRAGLFTCCDRMKHEMRLSDGTVKPIPCDKERLTIPMLGMYHQALEMYYSESTDGTGESGLYQRFNGISKRSLNVEDERWQSTDDFIKRIAKGRDRYFPTTFTATFGDDEKTKDLFGPLARKMEDQVCAKYQPELIKRLDQEMFISPRRRQRYLSDSLKLSGSLMNIGSFTTESQGEGRIDSANDIAGEPKSKSEAKPPAESAAPRLPFEEDDPRPPIENVTHTLTNATGHGEGGAEVAALVMAPSREQPAAVGATVIEVEEPADGSDLDDSVVVVRKRRARR